jgi:GH18 family chitinase
MKYRQYCHYDYIYIMNYNYSMKYESFSNWRATLYNTYSTVNKLQYEFCAPFRTKIHTIRDLVQRRQLAKKCV